MTSTQILFCLVVQDILIVHSVIRTICALDLSHGNMCGHFKILYVHIVYVMILERYWIFMLFIR